MFCGTWLKSLPAKFFCANPIKISGSFSRAQKVSCILGSQIDSQSFYWVLHRRTGRRLGWEWIVPFVSILHYKCALVSHADVLLYCIQGRFHVLIIWITCFDLSLQCTSAHACKHLSLTFTDERKGLLLQATRNPTFQMLAGLDVGCLFHRNRNHRRPALKIPASINSFYGNHSCRHPHLGHRTWAPWHQWRQRVVTFQVLSCSSGYSCVAFWSPPRDWSLHTCWECWGLQYLPMKCYSGPERYHHTSREEEKKTERN